MGVFAAGLTGAGALARRYDRNPACQNPLDLAVLCLAGCKAGRRLANDEVTSFLRQPFVKGQAHEGDGEEPDQGRDALEARGHATYLLSFVGFDLHDPSLRHGAWRSLNGAFVRG